MGLKTTPPHDLLASARAIMRVLACGCSQVLIAVPPFSGWVLRVIDLAHGRDVPVEDGSGVK
jgi:hypothetical protein